MNVQKEPSGGAPQTCNGKTDEESIRSGAAKPLCNTEPVRCAIIGTGTISRLFAEGARMVSGFEITSVYSRTPETGRAFCASIGVNQQTPNSVTENCPAGENRQPIRVFTDLEELLSSGCADAVYVASPNTLHFAQSLRCLQSGKHVLCEKPATVLPQELETLQKTAARGRLIFMEAVTLLHLPQLEILKTALDGIGHIREAFISYCQFSSKYAALQSGQLPNIFNPEFATGALMDIGVYCVNAVIALFGAPQDITANAVFVRSGADGCGSAIFTYPDLCVSLAYSKTGQGFAPSEFRGDRGTVTVDLISLIRAVTLHEHNKEPVTLFKTDTPDAHAAALAREAADFCRLIREPENTAAEYERLCRQSQLCAETLDRMRSSARIRFPGYSR